METEPKMRTKRYLYRIMYVVCQRAIMILRNLKRCRHEVVCHVASARGLRGPYLQDLLNHVCHFFMVCICCCRFTAPQAHPKRPCRTNSTRLRRGFWRSGHIHWGRSSTHSQRTESRGGLERKTSWTGLGHTPMALILYRTIIQWVTIFCSEPCVPRCW